jgi:hypothetical protein
MNPVTVRQLPATTWIESLRWRVRPTAFYTDPATGDLWRLAQPDEYATEKRIREHDLPEWLAGPHLILDVLVVDGIRYSLDRPADYTGYKPPALTAAGKAAA